MKILYAMDPRITSEQATLRRKQPPPSETIRLHRPTPEVLEAFAAEFDTNRSLQAMAARSPSNATYEQLFDRVHLEMIQCQRIFHPTPWPDLFEKIGYFLTRAPLRGGDGEGDEEVGMRPLRGNRSEGGSRASSRATRGIGGRSASRGSGGETGGASRMRRGPTRLGNW
ncbi:MAG: hypothetical protein Q9208_001852 [Pyrenodesmia sp. 3 TL-2023]